MSQFCELFHMKIYFRKIHYTFLGESLSQFQFSCTPCGTNTAGAAAAKSKKSTTPSGVTCYYIGLKWSGNFSLCICSSTFLLALAACSQPLPGTRAVGVVSKPGSPLPPLDRVYFSTVPLSLWSMWCNFSNSSGTSQHLLWCKFTY